MKNKSIAISFCMAKSTEYQPILKDLHLNVELPGNFLSYGSLLDDQLICIFQSSFQVFCVSVANKKAADFLRLQCYQIAIADEN